MFPDCIFTPLYKFITNSFIPEKGQTGGLGPSRQERSTRPLGLCRRRGVVVHCPLSSNRPSVRPSFSNVAVLSALLPEPGGRARADADVTRVRREAVVAAGPRKQKEERAVQRRRPGLLGARPSHSNTWTGSTAVTHSGSVLLLETTMVVVVTLMTGSRRRELFHSGDGRPLC